VGTFTATNRNDTRCETATQPRSVALATVLFLMAGSAFAAPSASWLDLNCTPEEAFTRDDDNRPRKLPNVFSTPFRISFVEREFSDAKNINGEAYINPSISGLGSGIYKADPHEIVVYFPRWELGDVLFKGNNFNFESRKGIGFNARIVFDRLNGTFAFEEVHTDGTLKRLPLGVWYSKMTGVCNPASPTKF
jgi:hypothetical protein